MGRKQPRKYRNFRGKGRLKWGGCKDPRGCGAIRCEQCGLPVRDHRVDIPCPFYDMAEEYRRGGR